MSKNQELEALFETVSQIYFKNIQFLQKHHSKLYEDIQKFEQNGIENYSLEFINNHFEILDTNGKATYNCDPFFDAQKRCENIKDKPSFNLIKDRFIENFVNYTNEISAYDFINEYVQNPSDKSNYDKFIFLGTLLGVHINDLHHHLQSKAYLIIEDDIEIFRLSLFLTDYEAINKDAKLFFIINKTEPDKKRIIETFIKYEVQYNHQIFFEVSDERPIHNIDILTQTFIQNDPLSYPFSEYLVSFKRSLKYFSDYKKHLQLNKQLNIINNPVLFLGAGPSLSHNIEWIYMNQDYFTIVCAAGALKRLELLDIVPDIILTVDGQYKQVLRQFNVHEKYYKNSIILASVKTDEKVIKQIYSDSLFFVQDSIEVFSQCGVFTGVTVGDIGLDLILKLGAKDIYMLGYDAAISQSGKTHDGTHSTGKITTQKAEIINNSGFNTKRDLIEVKGNHRNKVLTFILYSQMIESIQEITSNCKQNIHIYNLSDGAYFENTQPLYIKDIDISKFTPIEKNNYMHEFQKHILEKDHSTLNIEKLALNEINKNNTEFDLTNYQKVLKIHKNSLTLQIIYQFYLLLAPYVYYYNTTHSKKTFNDQYLVLLEKLTSICK